MTRLRAEKKTTNTSSRFSGMFLTAILLGISNGVFAHSDAGKLLPAPSASAIAQTICGPNGNGETASYSFRIRNLSPAYKDLVKLVVTKEGFSEQVVLSSKKARAYGAWGSLAGGDGVYTLTFSKVLAKSTTRKAVVFELEHHCSAANGGHTENESFVWIKR